jgi:ABC-type transport system involved in multi-copper enzyme maturation permease subunit
LIARHTFLIAQHEWRLILKEPRFLIPFLVTPLVLIGIQGFTVYFRSFGSDYETLLLARSLLLMLAVLAPSAAVPLGADSFAGEKERNTLEILLCLPVNMGSLFWGKVLGIYPLPVFMGWLGQAAMLGILASRDLILPGFQADALKAILLTPCLGLFLCAFATLMSLLADSVRSAAQLTSLAMLLVFFSVMFGSSWIFGSWIIFGFFWVSLIMASVACLVLARSRFPKLS